MTPQQHDGELAWATNSNFIITRDPVIHHVRRDPAQERHAERMYTR